jgi:hypothetical protein
MTIDVRFIGNNPPNSAFPSPKPSLPRFRFPSTQFPSHFPAAIGLSGYRHDGGYPDLRELRSLTLQDEVPPLPLLSATHSESSTAMWRNAPSAVWGFTLGEVTIFRCFRKSWSFSQFRFLNVQTVEFTTERRRKRKLQWNKVGVNFFINGRNCRISTVAKSCKSMKVDCVILWKLKVKTVSHPHNHSPRLLIQSLLNARKRSLNNS